MFADNKPWHLCRGFFLPVFWFLSSFPVALQTLAASPGVVDDERCATLDSALLTQTHRVKVKTIIDGDTLRLVDGRKIRLLAVNTPEKHVDSGQPEAFALEAARVADAFLGRQQEVLLLVGSEARDHYGRVLAHVFNLQGENLSAHLLTRGLGWHLAVPPNMRFADCLAGIERGARLAGRGVWQSDPTPVTAINAGGYQRIRGKLKSIHFGKTGSPWWLQFESKLSAVIYPEYQAYFKRRELARYTGQIVEVGGWVYADRRKTGSWRVKLTSHFDIERSPLTSE